MAASPSTMTPDYSVAGKTAIVTGAGSGINLEFASLLLSKGCNVLVADLSLRAEAEELVARHAASDVTPRAVFLQTDVTNWADLRKMFDTALAEFGDVDIVCPGAGVYEPHWSSFWHPPGSSESRDAAAGGHFALLDINLVHPIRATQLALAHWTNSQPVKPRRVVHISSIAAQVPNVKAPMYAASKSGISGFVRCLAPLEEKLGVRVNAVAPGLIRTPLWTEHPEKLLTVNAERDRWATPREVAEAMLRCVESNSLPGGSILEVGKDCTRQINIFNDPGPDMDPAKGLVASNGDVADQEVWKWLGDTSIWSPLKSK